jgi:hypothetical protein
MVRASPSKQKSSSESLTNSTCLTIPTHPPGDATRSSSNVVAQHDGLGFGFDWLRSTRERAGLAFFGAPPPRRWPRASRFPEGENAMLSMGPPPIFKSPSNMS